MNVAVGFLTLTVAAPPPAIFFLTFAPIAHTRMEEGVVRDRTETSRSLMDKRPAGVYVCV